MRSVYLLALAAGFSLTLTGARCQDFNIDNRAHNLETIGDGTPLRAPYHDRSPKETASLARKLDLSPDQATRVQPILADRLRQITRAMSDDSLSWKARRQERASIIARNDELIAPLLTERQRQRFAALEARHPFAAPGAPPPNVSWEPESRAPQH